MRKNRIKRAMAEAAGWLCLLGLVIVVAAMESGVLRPLAGGGIGLGLELAGALALYKAGVVRLPASDERGERIAAASVRAGCAMTGDGGRGSPHQSPSVTASPRGSREREAEKW